MDSGSTNTDGDLDNDVPRESEVDEDDGDSYDEDDEVAVGGENSTEKGVLDPLQRKKRKAERRLSRDKNAAAVHVLEELEKASAVLAASRLGSATCRPYHYGTHYSSSASVLHFLLRLQPYADSHVQFQG